MYNLVPSHPSFLLLAGRKHCKRKKVGTAGYEARLCIHGHNKLYRILVNLVTELHNAFSLSVSLGSCVNAGFDDCCVSGFCAGTPPNCFCDYFCTFIGDCCSDIDQICTEREYIGRY